MKTKKGIIIGITLFFFIVGGIAILKNNNDTTISQGELSNGAKYQIKTDGDEVEFIGFDERKPKYNSTQHQLKPIPSNSDSSASATDLNQSELRAMADLDTLIHDKFAPMTDWGRDVKFNHETNEPNKLYNSSIIYFSYCL